MPYCLQCGSAASMQVPAGDIKERLTCPECDYIHYENPNIICGTVAVHEDKVLLCRRAIEPRYGFWTLPAGFMEIGETVAEGAARETAEEAEAVATNLSLYCMYDIPQIGHVNMFYLSELKDGTFGAGCESLECRLFREDEIPWDEISFLTVEKTLKHYFNDKKNNTFPLHVETIEK